KADMSTGDPEQGGSGFHGFPVDRFLAADNTEGPGGGNAQPMHGLAAEIFPNAGAQYRPSVAPSGEGRHAGALEVKVPMSALWVVDFTQQQAAAISQVGIIITELVAGIFHGKRF